MNAVELIQRKRDHLVLAPDEIAWLIDSYTSGKVTDYQMAAMAMAVFLNGLDHEELVDWTGAMLRSGEVLDFSDIDRPKVDKHSTGGVGDKVSIPLAPMVGACGVAIPMMSGRGLGHTGGTLDKLESIPGFTTALDPDRFREVLTQCGIVLAGQSETLVPADRKLYALRDATGTVESIPLISSLDHVEEAGRRSRRSGARREGRVRRIHEGLGTRPASSLARWWGSASPTTSRPSRC